MMHHYSPSPRWLAVPGIGFPQNISVGPNVLNPQDFRDWSYTSRCKTDGQHDAAAQLIDCVASRSPSWPWLSVPKDFLAPWWQAESAANRARGRQRR